MSASTPVNYNPIPQDWRWVKPLRQRGQGSIHLYRRPEGDQVAVKFLRQQHERLVARSKRGIDILNRLNHDNVIRIFNWGVDPKYASFRCIFFFFDFFSSLIHFRAFGMLRLTIAEAAYLRGGTWMK